jgi:hypothetical protein
MMMMIIIIMVTTSTTAMIMIISMGNARNSRGNGLPGSGLPRDNCIGQMRRSRDHFQTDEELNKELLLLPTLPTPHVSEYRLSQISPSDTENDRFTGGHREDWGWP